MLLRHSRIICKAICALVAVCLSAAPAAALSCRPWGVTDGYLTAAKSDRVYNVISGRLRFDQAALPRAVDDDPNSTPELTAIPARLTGKMLAGQAFVQDVDLSITLEIRCLGPWCASAVDGLPYVAFVEQRAQGLVLEMSPCGGDGFPDENGEAARQLLDCHTGKACPRAADR